MILANVPDLATPVWLQWNFDSILVFGIALFTAAYFYALGPLRRRYGWAEAVDRGQVAWFVAGTVVIFIALCSPLDTLGDDYLFSAHMIQHMLLAIVAPPLWLLGTPDWMLAPLFRRASVLRVAKWLTNPIVAFGLFNANLWLWHVPALYDATLTNEQIHIFEHLTYIVFGVLLWWPILSPVRALPRISKSMIPSASPRNVATVRPSRAAAITHTKRAVRLSRGTPASSRNSLALLAASDPLAEASPA